MELRLEPRACALKHCSTSPGVRVRGGEKVLHKEETAQAKVGKLEQPWCVLRKGVMGPLGDENSMRGQAAECLLSPADA